MRQFFIIICFIGIFPFICSAGEILSPAGSVKNVKGTANILRNGKILTARPGTRIFPKDVLKTGEDGALGIILQDNTIFSMGPSSELKMKNFLFDPIYSRFSLAAKMVKGTFSYLSGMIAKLSPKSVKIETPVGTIGIRGTKFLAKIN